MAILLYTILAVVIIIYEIFRKKKYVFDPIFFVNVSYLLFYVLTPIILAIMPEWQSQIGLFRIYAVNIYSFDLSIIVFLGYLLLITGWYFGDFIKSKPFKVYVNSRKAQEFACIGLIIGFAAYILYVASFGGILNSLVYGSALRYGRVDFEVLGVGKGEVFRYFLPTINMVFLFYISKYFAAGRLNMKELRYLYLSTLLLGLYLLSISSRGAIVNVITAIFFLNTYSSATRINLTKVFKRKYFKFILLIPVFFFIVLYGKQTFWALPALLTDGLNGFIEDFIVLNNVRLGENSNFIRDGLLRETSHGIASLRASISENYSYLYFRDYLLLPFHIVPTRLLGWDLQLPITVSTLNTYLLQDLYLASTPPGILAMLIYNSGYFGLTIMWFYGFVGKVIQNKLQMMGNSPSRNLILYYFGYLYGGFIANGDIKVYVFGAFPLVLLILILYFRKGIINIQKKILQKI
jgi:hypothetical protein